jgi:ATP-dependent 26S proteasome regulatory subunit
MANPRQSISSLIYAGCPWTYVRTSEQERAYEEMIETLRREGPFKLNVYVWKANTGLVRKQAPQMLFASEGDTRMAQNLSDSIRFIMGQPAAGPDDLSRPNAPVDPKPNSIFFFFNPRPYFQGMNSNPTPQGLQLMQALRDAVFAVRTVGSYMVMIGPDFEFPPELADLVTFYDFPLPSKDEIQSLFTRMVTGFYKDSTTKVDEEEVEKAAESMIGVPLIKAENAISLSLSDTDGIDLELLQNEKEQIIRQSSALKWIRDAVPAENLGGFDVALDEIQSRKMYFEHPRRAMDFGLSAPKGILVVGPPGTGKTLCAKVAANVLGLRLYSFNFAGIFRGIVGKSEETLQTNLRMMEALAPCAMLFDEFEKAVAGLESSGKSDSGVTSRAIGSLLSWMQDCRLPIYKIATCNSVRNLDGALFRKGRWDEIYGVWLPTLEERKLIMAIHIRQRRRDPSMFDLDQLAEISDKFVGAEIEAAVESALYRAFNSGKDLDTEGIAQAIRRTVPLAVTDAESVSEFEGWIKKRAINVSSSYSPSAVTPARASGSSAVPVSGGRRVVKSKV